MCVHQTSCTGNEIVDVLDGGGVGELPRPDAEF